MGNCGEYAITRNKKQIKLFKQDNPEIYKIVKEEIEYSGEPFYKTDDIVVTLAEPQSYILGKL